MNYMKELNRIRKKYRNKIVISILLKKIRIKNIIPLIKILMNYQKELKILKILKKKLHLML